MYKEFFDIVVITDKQYLHTHTFVPPPPQQAQQNCANRNIIKQCYTSVNVTSQQVTCFNICCIVTLTLHSPPVTMMFFVWEKSNTFTPLYTLNTEWSALSLTFGWFHVICWRARLRSCIVGDSRNSRICCSTCVLPLVHPGGDHKNFRLRGRSFSWHDNLLPKLLFVEWHAQLCTDLLSN